VALVLAGRVGEGLHAQDRPVDVLDAKGIVEGLLSGVGVSWRLGPDADRPFHPARTGTLHVDDRPAGILGELHPADAARRDLAGRVAVAELDVASLGIRADAIPIYRDVPRFPPVRRDLAVIVDEDVPVGAVDAAIRDAVGELLGRSVLFDVFRGAPVPEGRKSLAFSLEFRAADRTLTDEEVEPVIERIVARLRDHLDGELRA
jgi:phenylalanyl-tRNA synthetase beta chain